MKMELRIEHDGKEMTVSFPAKFQVCPRCAGVGKHMNPAIDENGITGSEWEEICHDDQDFPEKYFGGFYDITCHECKGKRVVLEVDESALDQDEAELYEQWQDQEEKRESEDRADARVRRMENGGYDY